MTSAGDDGLLPGVPTFSSFSRIADPAIYRPLPDDWVLGLADVVNSTAAVAAGRYKVVNVAGASVISAVANATGRDDIPYVFGGDGAVYAVPPELAASAEGALRATSTLAREEFDLELRIGTVPVGAVRAAGHDVRVARFAPSPDVAYAMFSGGGLAWAEEQLKAGAFELAPAPPGTRPDLTGLSCRFAPIPSRRGTVLSLMVRSGSLGDSAFRDAVARLLALIDDSPDAKPVPDTGPSPVWPSPGIEIEARASRRAGSAFWPAYLRHLARTLAGYLVIRFRIPIGRFDPTRYLAELVANSDYRKYDDGLRMTLDCDPATAARLEDRLREDAGAGALVYGLHRQATALVTCYSPNVHRAGHVHFIDGADGGYAEAARLLKAAG